MPRLELQPLPSDKRARYLVELLDRLHRDRARVVVWVADEGRRQILDDYLWTYQKTAFVPHLLWTPRLGEVEDPIVLVGEPANPNGADVLVVGDELPPAEWAAAFEAVYDFIEPGEAGERRRAAWTRWEHDHAAR